MKGKAIIPLVLGLAVGLLAVKFGVDSIRKAQASSEKTETVKAVRAREDISAYQEIKKEMVEVIETADSLFAPMNDRIETIEDVVGRVTSKAIPARAPVLLSMLADKGTRAGMVGRIQPGFRAVSVKIDETTSVGYQLAPGDWVDVIVVMDVDTGAGRGGKETIAEVILEHVQVGAIGRGPQDNSGQKTSKSRPAKSATLLVPEAEVPKLHLAGTRGKLTLAMRGDDPKTSGSSFTARSGDLFNKFLPKLALKTEKIVKATPKADPDWSPPHEVAVYRGGNKSETAVERIVFESSDSSKILEVSKGPPSRAGNTMRAGSRTRSSK